MADLTPGGIARSGVEVQALKVLIDTQKSNIRLLSSASAIMFALGAGLFVVFYLNKAIGELGPAVGDLLTFASSLFPITGVVAAKSRIGELEAARMIVSQADLTPHEQDLLSELLKK